MKTIIFSAISVLTAMNCFGQTTPNFSDPFLQKNYLPDATIQPGIDLRGVEDLADSLYHWSWVLYYWDLSSKTIYTYSGEGLIKEEKTMSFENDTWVNNSRQVFNYNKTDELTDNTGQVWDGSAWVNSTRDSYSYDSEGNQLSILNMEWNGMEWDSNYMFNYTYGDFHNVLTFEISHWFGMWVTGMRHTYMYNANQRIEHRLIESWNGTEWINNVQVLYAYDINGDLDITINQRWINDAWVDQERNLYDFDTNHNILTAKTQISLGEMWEDSYLFTYTYDKFSNITGLLHEEYFEGEWLNVYRFKDEYDDRQNRISEVFQNWIADEWVNQDSLFNFFSPPSSIQTIGDKDRISIYPNPVTTTLQYQLEGKQDVYGTVLVVSSKGTSVQETHSHLSSGEINVSRLQPGTYFLIMHHEKGVSVEKFVKQ